VTTDPVPDAIVDTLEDAAPDPVPDAVADPTEDPVDDPVEDPTTDSGCPDPDPTGGYDPSGGSGGTAGPGGTWDFTTSHGSGHVYVRIPASYSPSTTASPVVCLFNESTSDWSPIADAENIILVDLDEYNDVDAYVNKLNALVPQLEAQYNVDRARYYWAGWSAGGNIVVILAAGNQDTVAGTMVFPGTGGNYARDALADRAAARTSDPCLHLIKLFYACGDEDGNYDYGGPVEYEADSWASWYGYTTYFELVEGSGHYISESVYHIRQQAWDWIEGYNLYN
jgi:predicted esterase